MRRNWKKIMGKVKPEAHSMANQEQDGKILTKFLWYAIVGKYGVKDTTSDYTLFKREVVKARREDPQFNSIFKDEDRYRNFDYGTTWTTQAKRVITTSEKKTLESFLREIGSYFKPGAVITRGSISETVMAEMLEVVDERTVVLHIGDFNPKGKEIFEKLKAAVEHKGGKAEWVLINDVKVVKRYKLPRPVAKERGAKKECVELWRKSRWPTAEADALVARHRNVAKALMVRAILRHIDPDAWTRFEVLSDASSKAGSRVWDAVFKFEEPASLKKLRELLGGIDERIQKFKDEMTSEWGERYRGTVDSDMIEAEKPKLRGMETQRFHEPQRLRQELETDVGVKLGEMYRRDIMTEIRKTLG
ncbi:MAG: hypothetical protein HWN68_10785 [Desulfobacterales bacterium]|nr:hypothetical protein [Desulfobacterales bacterium]